MPVKAFLFDCGGVLLRNGDLSAYETWEHRLGLQSGELARRLWTGETWSRAELGEISDDEFWDSSGHQLGLHDANQIAALRRDLWATWVLDETVLRLIDAARQRQTVALLSNATDALEETLRTRYRVADRFDLIVNSARIGVAKPDERIFKEALDRLELEPAETVFIDDRVENITAAAALGMHVIWFVQAPDLERQLQVYLNHNHRENNSEALA